MTKAAKVIKIMDDIKDKDEQVGVGKPEPQGSAVNVKALKIGQRVFFKKGHELEGSTGIVSNTNVKANTVDVRLGSSNRFSVPAADLLQDNNPPAVG